LAQVLIKKVPFFQVGIAYIPWGPLWRAKGVKPDIDIFREILEAVNEEYGGKRGLVVRVSPNEISTASDEITSVLCEKGFKKTSQPYRTLLLDIRPPFDALRKSLDQKWRNQLNRAEKNGLEVIDGKSDDLYSNFLSLYNELLERKQFETHVSVEEFRRIQKDLEEPSKMHIFLCFSEARPVSALVGSAMGDRGIYLLGATSDNGMKTKGSYLLQWRMIEWLKKMGCSWYDLGGIDPDGNPGVYHFKAGLPGQDVRHVGQFDYSQSWLCSTLVRARESLKRQHKPGEDK
jgi:lipid II:glycine glycyltransferase (peptidoglycan interpeptide bridge formation enzyme)